MHACKPDLDVTTCSQSSLYHSIHVHNQDTVDGMRNTDNYAELVWTDASPGCCTQAGEELCTSHRATLRSRVPHGWRTTQRTTEVRAFLQDAISLE